ncbi:ganglioside-induced differentiation-associated protein 1 [Elysia marginata]|uniref:Ganglioside-induced differentiation-associated protein 1 n=1 Tax=Elysia marginata TaxID=1093978 RepID=A0AAV4FT06_9GAST|nr:ganglioside-induced differentiation-associated protein 1 [Elysia marginata]
MSLQLFYWPTSSASQKALMAMEEKQLKFKGTIVNITEGEQNQGWYLRINSAGQVPVLQIEDHCLSESDVIVEKLDKLNNGEVGRMECSNHHKENLLKKGKGSNMDFYQAKESKELLPLQHIKQKNKLVKTAARNDKKTYLEDKASEAQEAAFRGDTQTLYTITRDLTRTNPSQPSTVKDEHGKLITKLEDQCKRLANHFKT